MVTRYDSFIVLCHQKTTILVVLAVLFFDAMSVYYKLKIERSAISDKVFLDVVVDNNYLSC